MVEAVRLYDPALPVLGLPGSALLRPRPSAGLRTVTRRSPTAATRRRARWCRAAEPGALLHDPHEVAARVVRMVTAGSMAVDGSDVAVSASSVCVHGDSPGAVAMAVAVRDALPEAGVDVRPFAHDRRRRCCPAASDAVLRRAATALDAGCIALDQAVAVRGRPRPTRLSPRWWTWCPAAATVLVVVRRPGRDVAPLATAWLALPLVAASRPGASRRSRREPSRSRCATTGRTWRRSRAHRLCREEVVAAHTGTAVAGGVRRVRAGLRLPRRR